MNHWGRHVIFNIVSYRVWTGSRLQSPERRKSLKERGSYTDTVDFVVEYSGPTERSRVKARVFLIIISFLCDSLFPYNISK
jgi:hypothetical protein